MTHSESLHDKPLLRAVLNCLIPSDAGFPSGEIAYDHLDGVLHADARAVALLQAIEAQSRATHSTGFTSLAVAEQTAVLRATELSQAPAFNALLAQAYGGYYSHPAVVKALGLPPGPPSKRPHQLAPLNPSRLAQVAARGPIYKPV